ncbi:type I-E CRISPR-associated protein Cas7/Cse4/CasC [Bombella mellum]|uniref:Type I-E CRISPR-associated protein Cas7/Cse4/CasC n=1 Tax=Bombella mellum TaxID=2039288 RepID=A0ABR5ZUA2_9PROT|nr:type I-E CRISPR-associated protein Cas7/Cse4/CasC [Bombella mellum]MBA5727906.1 type I-E CRISPR-associated protein Cas7/Cse4/CasC [Bombella mellum]
MTTFVQFHVLTTYGPSNPNRDDMGKPKQVEMGGEVRLRHSSQSVKRALRESTFFSQDLTDHMGKRTKRLHGDLVQHLLGKGVVEKDALEAADTVAAIFGKLEPVEKGSDAKIATTLAFISPEERRLAEELAEKAAAGEKLPKDKGLKKLVLRRADGAVDVAMFGRMLASDTDFNRDAAVQVAHAFTTHRSISQEDWFSAVDDLNRDDKQGAAHIGESAFGTGVFYQYVCVNVDLLVDNLAGDRELAVRAMEALARALSQATPRGKQNSHAHHPRAHFMLAERGEQAPRDLSGAFFNAVKERPLLETSIEELKKMRGAIDRAYGQCWDAEAVMHLGREGTVDEIAAFAGKAVRGK